MTGPLSGLRVIDLTQVLSGPFCTMLLADLGADVIKIEPPEGDVSRQWGPFVDEDVRTYGGYFASVNRNKRSVVLDLKSPDGIAGLHRLLAGADVLVENFRVGVMDRLGLSWESLHERYPRLVYAAIRGFGDPRTGESPYAHWPAFDIIAQAMGGIMSITGPDPTHPVKAGPGIGDTYPATLAAVGILAAAWRVQRTGAGDFVDVALYDAILALSERIVYQHSITGEIPHPQGNTHPLLCPYGVVPTRDGHWAIAAPTDHHWRMLATAMGRPELGDDPRFATNAARLANSGEVYRIIEEWTGSRSTDELMGQVGGEFPCAPVNTAADIRRDPHTAARSMIHPVEHPSGVFIDIAGTPVKLASGTDSPPRRAPLLGEHTAELLSRDR